MAQLGYIQLTRDCMQSCRFCSNPPTGVAITADDLYAAIDELAERRYDGVVFTGGEPTLSPLLFQALAHARHRGLASRIITNGQRLADAEFFARCVEAGLTHLHLSLYSHDPATHDFISRTAGGWQRSIGALALVSELGISCDINTVINAYNSDHLDETVIWLVERFPFVRHFVWNNIDPDGNRAEENPDSIPRLPEFQVSLERAMRFLEHHGRSFRAERVPLCYMRHFAGASTETRKIIKGEERTTRFLDAKGLVRQQRFFYDKAEVCAACGYSCICAGLYSLGSKYDARDLSPVFADPMPVIRAVLGYEPRTELLRRLRLCR